MREEGCGSPRYASRPHDPWTSSLVQFLNGLASASSLFLVASGLSIIFGVTRIVNFAHGSFYMLGAYLAWTLRAARCRAGRSASGAAIVAGGARRRR